MHDATFMMALSLSSKQQVQGGGMCVNSVLRHFVHSAKPLTKDTQLRMKQKSKDLAERQLKYLYPANAPTKLKAMEKTSFGVFEELHN